VPASPFNTNDEKSATPFASVVTVAPDNDADPDDALNDAVTAAPGEGDKTFPAASIN